MEQETGVLICYGCGKPLLTGESVRFIRFDDTTQMFHKKCRQRIQAFIEEMHQENLSQ